MPTYVPGMTYHTNNDPNATAVPIVSQADLDNLVAAGMNITTPQGNATTATNTIANYQQQASDMLSGMTSPMTLDQIRQREADERAARRASADALFNPQISRARVIGEKQVSSAGGVTGQNMGFNISTAEVQFINSVQNQVDDKINEIVKSKADWIATGDFEAARRADDAIAKLSEYNNNLIMKKAELALSLRSDQRSQDQFNLDLAKTLTDIPVGQTINIGGVQYTGIKPVEAFFKGSDLVSMMNDITYGEVRTVTDPNTGEEYSITGTANPDVYIATNNSGTVTGIDKRTGKVLYTVKGAANAKTGTGGGTTGGVPTAFWADAQKEVAQLQKGEPWGAVWDRLRLKYPTVPGDYIDVALGGSGEPGKETGWAQPGYYDSWKQGQYKDTETNITDSERQRLFKSFIAQEASNGTSPDELRSLIENEGYTVNELYGYDVPFGL